jgi:hypothetical protein
MKPIFEFERIGELFYTPQDILYGLNNLRYLENIAKYKPLEVQTISDFDENSLTIIDEK